MTGPNNRLSVLDKWPRSVMQRILVKIVLSLVVIVIWLIAHGLTYGFLSIEGKSYWMQLSLLFLGMNFVVVWIWSYGSSAKGTEQNTVSLHESKEVRKSQASGMLGLSDYSKRGLEKYFLGQPASKPFQFNVASIEQVPTHCKDHAARKSRQTILNKMVHGLPIGALQSDVVSEYYTYVITAAEVCKMLSRDPAVRRQSESVDRLAADDRRKSSEASQIKTKLQVPKSRSISDEIERLHAQYREGTLSKQEFELAKRLVLKG